MRNYYAIITGHFPHLGFSIKCTYMSTPSITEPHWGETSCQATQNLTALLQLLSDEVNKKKNMTSVGYEVSFTVTFISTCNMKQDEKNGDRIFQCWKEKTVVKITP